MNASVARAVEQQIRIAETKLLYGDDLFGFCREVLGYTDMIPDALALLPGYSHEDLCTWLMAEDQALCQLLLMPRYSFKSYIAVVGRTLWKLMDDPNRRFLFYSDVNEKAESNLELIKAHILGKVEGSTFRQRLSPWEVNPKQGVWNQQQIVIRPRTTAYAEPTVDTAGMETSKTKMHYDEIVFDDFITDKNVTTRELIEKAKAVYRNSRSLLKPGGRILMLGTPWDFFDLYAEVQAREEERRKSHDAPIFAIYKRAAEVEGKYPFASIGLTKAFLQEQRTEQGSYLYSCLYQLEPVDEATATFKASDFTFYDPTKRPEGLFITGCLDPIPRHEASRQGDDAALTVCGTDHRLNLYVLEIVAGRLQPDEQIDALFRLHARWGLKVFAMEAIAFQRELRPAIERRFAEERATNPMFRFFEIREITSRESTKTNRIRALQPYHERGALKFPGNRLELLDGPYAKLASQMLKFPKSSQDDILDSLADHLAIHRAGSQQEERTEFPWSSAAWFERRQREQRIREQARLPRWQQKPLPELAFS